MATKHSITIIGPGSLGGALAIALHEAGFPIAEIVYRGDGRRARSTARRCGARAVEFEKAAFASDLVWIAVPDAAIATVAGSMRHRADWQGKTVFHSSGALSSGELRALQESGARTASVHPMMSFVRASRASFAGVSFALEGDAPGVRLARQIAKGLGGNAFLLKKKDKALYHALGAFSSPLLIAQMAAGEEIGRKLGLSPNETRRVIGPILRRTLENYLQHGAAAAFSGPIARGDLETVRRHMEALARVPGLLDVYRALAKMAVEKLPGKRKASIRKLLSEASG
jgi:predicted short-subunit dehydrogenase-like oxidoreductase (DUF2520 family)